MPVLSRFFTPSPALPQPTQTTVYSPSRLPVELYRPIVEAVDTKNDLHTLLFVSKALQAESERVIYSAIHIEDQSIHRRLQLFKHLTNCQRIASHVRTLSIFPLPRPRNQFGYYRGKVSKYFRYINNALCALNHLQHLFLVNYIIPNSRHYPPFSLLAGCKFQLQSLSIFGIRPLDQTALENQKDIKELYVRYGESFSLPSGSTFASSLTILSVTDNGNPAQATPLHPLSIKRVKALDVTCHLLSIVSTMGYPLPSITSLSLRDCSQEFINFPLLFPSLRYICLNFDRLLWSVFNNCMHQFQELPALQKIQFNGQFYAGFEFPVKVHTWFFTMDNLESLVIQIKYHMEWVRGDTHAALVSPDENEWKDARWIIM